MTGPIAIARIFPWGIGSGGGGGGEVIVFKEKRSLLVDRLGFTSECYSKVEQKGAGGGGGGLGTLWLLTS